MRSRCWRPTVARWCSREARCSILGLIDTATVYTEGSSGTFDTSVKTGLHCRLAHISGRGGNVQDRAELLALRQLLWEPSYVMAETVQIEVNGDGVRWNAVHGTFGALRGPSGAVMYRRADLVRVDS